jgi:hypothetical protein
VLIRVNGLSATLAGDIDPRPTRTRTGVGCPVVYRLPRDRPVGLPLSCRPLRFCPLEIEPCEIPEVSPLHGHQVALAICRWDYALTANFRAQREASKAERNSWALQLTSLISSES